MDVIYLNGWVAVYQFMASLLFAVPSAYAMGLPVPVRSGGVMTCFGWASVMVRQFIFWLSISSHLKKPAVGWVSCLHLADAFSSLRVLPGISRAETAWALMRVFEVYLRGRHLFGCTRSAHALCCLSTQTEIFRRANFCRHLLLTPVCASANFSRPGHQSNVGAQRRFPPRSQLHLHDSYSL